MKRPPFFLQNGGSCLSTIVLTISLKDTTTINLTHSETDSGNLSIDVSAHFWIFTYVRLSGGIEKANPNCLIN